MLEMACSSFDVNEQDMIQPTLSWDSNEYGYDVAPTDATFYPCPFFNSSGYYYQDGLLQGIMPLPSIAEEEEPIFYSDPWDEIIDGEEANWFRRCKSIFAWEDNYGSVCGIVSNDLDNVEYLNPTEEQRESSFSCQDEDAAENYPAASEYDYWSFCDSLLEYGGNKVCSSYSWVDDSDVAYERWLRECAVYEGMFGYWPCLYRRN